jgi:peptidoglycan/LPS O-acetylase OafA/YrhL
MGSYRFVLAILVTLSHVGVVIAGHNSGVSAVISFYLLSGFVMTALIRDKYGDIESVGSFYLDRAMRLLPQFLLYTVLTLALVLVWPPTSPFVSDITTWKVVLNIAMLPLNFFMFGGLETSILIPQAWSLGLEAFFYLAIPWLLLYKVRVAAFTMSVVVFMLAYIGVLNTDWWGYRFLPGTLFIFLIGSLMHERKPYVNTAIFLCFACAAALLTLLIATPSLQRPYNFEVLVGLIVGLPMVYFLKGFTTSKLDAHIGNLSYGMFLNHFFLIWLFEGFGMEVSNSLSIITLLICSAALSAITYRFVEKPILRLRRRLRDRQLLAFQPTV